MEGGGKQEEMLKWFGLVERTEDVLENKLWEKVVKYMYIILYRNFLVLEKSHAII